MKKIYVGCALYDAPKEFVDGVLAFKDALRGKYEVLDFFPEGDASTEEIVTTDLGHVRNCDLFVAICDYPSLGLGIEIGKANEMRKSILCFSRSEDISRMVRGNHFENENSLFSLYDEFSEIVTAVDKNLKGR